MPNSVNKVKKNNNFYNIQDSRISDVSNFITVDGVQTLNNKTLTSPVIKGTITSDASGVIFDTPIKFYQPIKIEAKTDGRIKWSIGVNDSASVANGRALKFGLLTDDSAPIMDVFSYTGNPSSATSGFRIKTDKTTQQIVLETYHGDGSDVDNIWKLPILDDTDSQIIALRSDIKNDNIVNSLGSYSLAQRANETNASKGGTALGNGSAAFGFGNKQTHNFAVDSTRKILTIVGDSVDEDWLNWIVHYSTDGEDDYVRIIDVDTNNNTITLERALSDGPTAITVDIITHVAKGNASFIEGKYNQAYGEDSHAEGAYTAAVGHNSHAEGYWTQALGKSSHAGGHYTIAGHDYQTVIGKLNNNLSDTLFEVGNGNLTTMVPNNAFVVHSDGRVTIGKAPTNGMDVVNKNYLESVLPTAVPNLQLTNVIIEDATTNMNGGSPSGFTSIRSTNKGYPGVRIQYNNSSTITESRAADYMKTMTGSTLVPKFSESSPQCPVFVDSNGRIYKPEWQSDGLFLYDVKNPYARKLWKHTLKQTGSSAYYAIVLITNSPEPIPNYVYTGNIGYNDHPAGLFPYLTNPTDYGVISYHYGYLNNGAVNSTKQIIDAMWYRTDMNQSYYWIAVNDSLISNNGITRVDLKSWTLAADEVTPYDSLGEY